MSPIIRINQYDKDKRQGECLSESVYRTIGATGTAAWQENREVEALPATKVFMAHDIARIHLYVAVFVHPDVRTIHGVH
jgi:hypothetical protein